MATPSSMPSPRSIFPAGSESCGGNTFAQLVSRFEILDVVSNVGSRRDSHASPKTKPGSAVKGPSTIHRQSPRLQKQFSHASTRTRDRSSTNSSQISPGRFITPRRGGSPRPRRAQTLGTKSPTILRSDATMRPRQQSVAERRKMFESADNKFTATQSASKLAHSKSWQSIKKKRSAPGPQTKTTASPSTSLSTTATQVQQYPSLLPASTTGIPSPRTLIASDDPFGTWRTPMSRPDDSWSSFKRDSFVVTVSDTSPSYIKSQYIEQDLCKVPSASKTQVNIEPVLNNRTVEAQSLSTEDPQHQGWVQNARKMASSLSSSLPVAAASARTQSHPSRNVPRQAPDAVTTFKSFRFGRTNTSSRQNLPRSRISSLRRKFDLPKSETAASVPFDDTKRRQNTFTKAEIPDWPSRIPLAKSSTISDLGSAKSRSKSHAPCWDQQPGDQPRTPIGRRKTEKNISPLKQRIDLFESLDSPSPASGRSEPVLEKRKSLVSNTHGKGPSASQLKALKGTLRRISTSFRRSSSEWSTTSSRQNTMEIAQVKDKEGIPADKDRMPFSPHTFGSIPERPALSQTHLANEISPLEISKWFSLHQQSLVRPGFNIDGEAGLNAPGTVTPVPLLTESQSRLSKTKLFRTRTANRFSLPDLGDDDGPFRLLKDTRHGPQRSSSPFVSRASCNLEQPRPVRANELRRLVSMCKHKVRKISGGRSE
ncbi:hypothetical protein FZEAL_9384 [Fusarium zealandicum]|uniref:Uncharacterized protein n=1 Tax=Fusarium zealandicum TaxID=1053134 RepID=A0A8H4XFF9_9HYPO|nr:hypothetical protein FZEAL_9384 [Fusarium zealandicum]